MLNGERKTPKSIGLPIGKANTGNGSHALMKSEQHNDVVTQMAIQQLGGQSKKNVLIAESPPGLYEPLSETLKQEILQSTKFLNESTELLHEQTKSLLAKEPHCQRIVLNMNALAKLIQTKVNLFKVIK
jgi:hypothetical protein